MSDYAKYIPATVKVLGTDGSTGEVFLWATDTRSLHRVTKIDDLTQTRIVQIAGVVAWQEIVDRFDDPATAVKVIRLYKLGDEIEAATVDAKRTALERQRVATDKQIDELVAELYGLTPAERAMLGTRI